MIHARHFAATVNIKTEKQHSDCSAIVIEIIVIILEMQYNSVDHFRVPDQVKRLSFSVRKTNKNGFTFRPKDMLF